jgi:hypothetical protein
MLTVADWNSFPDDDLLRHEIIGGEHYTQRGATWRHQQVLGKRDDQTVKIFRRAGERLQPVPAPDPIATPVLPGFSLNMGAVFRM